MQLYDSDDGDWDQMVSAAQVVMGAATAMMDEAEENKSVDHRSLARSTRKIYRHDQAKHCIDRDYLRPDALFGADFALQFAISRPRFQKLMEGIAATNNPFYLKTVSVSGKVGSSFEARLLLPLKTLSYGVATHCFCDYFQMSKQFARDACKQFDAAVATVYQDEFLRLPTAEDIKDIYTLHKHAHKVNGMFGSLDCSHTYWKNCPTAWQGSYKGKEGKPSIVLEGICDYHLFFWHVSYGYAGTMNDKNILSMSPLLGSMIDGTFEELEAEAGVVPYTIEGTVEPFQKGFILVDGIYPRYSRFVKGIKEPMGPAESRFTQWQESARKDIERAFGVLKNKFQFMDRPMHLYQLNDIAARVTTCMILHNVCVSDRVMGSVDLKYSPAHTLEEVEVVMEKASDLVQVQLNNNAEPGQRARGGIGINGADRSIVNLVARKERFKELKNLEEYIRLHAALMNLFNK
jgi:hypothetical protein